MVKSRLLHPLVLMLLGNTLFIVTAGYTAKDSALRLISFIIFLALSYGALFGTHEYIQNDGLIGRTIGALIGTAVFSFWDRLLVRKWSYGHQYLGPIDDTDELKKKQSRWAFGRDVSQELLCTGSALEASNVAHFSEKDWQYVPSQSMFLLTQVGLIIGNYYLKNFGLSLQLQPGMRWASGEYVPFFGRLSSMSLEEIIARAQITLGHWITTYGTIQVCTAIPAAVAVLLNSGHIKKCRPMFGSLSSAYTIRKFWNPFWHQRLQLSIKGPARFITFKILHLPPGTVLARYSNIFFAFLASGLIHIASDFGGGVPLLQSGAINFFCVQTLGIIIEDSVQGLYRRKFGNEKSLVCRVVGYIWVFAFLTWSTPVWVYPLTRIAMSENMNLSMKNFRALFVNLL